MKKVFKLGYIHCAGCSVALQEKISKVPNVNSAQINFVSKLVTVDINNKDSKKTMQDIESAIYEFDKTIKILPPDQEEKKLVGEYVSRWLLAISIILWISAILVEHLTKLFWLELSLYLVAYFLVAYNVLLVAAKNLIKGKMLDENFLMSIATIGAFIIGEYLESVAVMIFYSIGEIFQDLATTRSSNRIKSLSSLKIDKVNVVNLDGSVTELELSAVKIGDTIRVAAGERVPLDGKIVKGGANFNTSAITGESIDVYLESGSDILSGYFAEDGGVDIKVTTDESSCTVSKIVNLVQEAAASKANTEKFISKFARVYTPIVVALAAIICFIMPAFFGYTLSAFTQWCYRGLSFLVVSCPCALVLSVPLSYFAGVGAAAKSGILVKGSNYLEILSKTKNIVFDKTGTLTTGEFSVSKIVSVSEMEETEVLEFIAYGESFSNHRIAKSIYAHYVATTGKSTNIAWVSDYTEVPGGGVTANLFMTECIIGNAEFLRSKGIVVPDIDVSDTVVFLACGTELKGYICVSDTIKSDSKDTVDLLNEMGIHTYMFTGDNSKVATKVQKELALNDVKYSLLPTQKVSELNLVKQTGTTAFVGDGINDAPALTGSDVGIAMGGVGSDIAVESADVVLMTDEPIKIIDAIKVAKNTQKIVLENVVFTIGLKVLTLILISCGLAGMWVAVFADVGVSVLAILNSLRAMKKYNTQNKIKQKNKKNRAALKTIKV